MQVEIIQEEDKKFSVKIEGRVDTTNVPELEKEIFSFVEENTGANLIIDLEKLEYISSAGLRFFLKLKKKDTEFKLINVSNEVYDIFDMTGFTNILDVQKCYRELSVDGCSVIGKGANGVVYRLDKETILKLYTKKDCIDMIEDERNHAKTALMIGIPTAISFDIVKCGEYYGTVFELLDAKSLVQELNEAPETIHEKASEYVELLKEVHALNKDDVHDIELPSVKASLLKWVDFLKDSFEPDEYKKMLEIAESLPEEDCILHGDCQPNNVMATNDGLLFIDMDTLAYGDPLFELSYLYATLSGYRQVDPEDSLTGMSKEMCEEFFKEVFDIYYQDLPDEKREELLKKCQLIAMIQVCRNMVKHVARRGVDKKEKAIELVRNILGR